MDMSPQQHMLNGVDGPLFEPPYPPRPQFGRPPSLREQCSVLRILRRDILGVFWKDLYDLDAGQISILRRKVILFNQPELIREALVSNHDIFERKSSQVEQALKPLIFDGLFVSHGDLWRERRNAVSPIVHASKVKSFAPVMTKVVSEWADEWHRQSTGFEVDIISEMAQLTAEIISRAVFGNNLGRKNTGKIVAGFKEFQEAVDQVDVLFWLGFSDKAPRWIKSKVKHSASRVQLVVDEIVKSLRSSTSANQTDRPIISRLFEARTDTGEPLSAEAIRNEAITIFMAGHETTANTLAWAIYNLANCDRSRGRLLEELNVVLGGRPAEYNDVPKLKYARCVIEETLRLYPPVPILARRAKRAGQVGRIKFPADAVLVISPWVTHRNPKLWANPDCFIPERFDESSSERASKYAYLPFAAGPRTCPGLMFGLTEAIIVLASLMQDFEMTVKPGFVAQPKSRLTLRPGDELPMNVAARQAPARARHG